MVQALRICRRQRDKSIFSFEFEYRYSIEIADYFETGPARAGPVLI